MTADHPGPWPWNLNTSLVAIALGSNLPSHLRHARGKPPRSHSRLAILGHIKAISSFHTTAPVGYLDQPQIRKRGGTARNYTPSTRSTPWPFRNRTRHGPRPHIRPTQRPTDHRSRLVALRRRHPHHPLAHAASPSHAPARICSRAPPEIAPTLQHSTLHTSIAELLAAL